MKTLYCHFSNIHHYRIIEILNNDYSWDPVYILGHDAKQNFKKLKKKPFSCFVEDQKKLRFGIFNLSNEAKYTPIENSIFEKLSPFLINLMEFQIVDDANGNYFSFSERKRYIYDALNYWNSVILSLKPEIVVYFTGPHTPAEYPLYLLAKHIFNIPVIIINPVPLFDNNYHFISFANDSNPSALIKNYQSKKYLSPSANILKYFEKVKSNNITPEYIETIYKKNYRLVNIPLNLFKEIIMGIVEFNLFEKGWHMMKINNKSYSDIKSRPNRFENALNIAKRSFQNLLSKLEYNKSIHSPKFNGEKFIYFSASYQPEALTNINAGFYSDHFQVLDILSNVIPNDWLIYYKEHPATFSTLPGFRGSLVKSKQYYDRLKSYGNIRLMSTNTKTTKLIDASKFVATIGGTVGWESILRGTPTLSFGSSWYHDCKSVFVIKSIDDAKKAVNKVIDGYIPDQEDILSYAASLENISYKLLHRDFKKNIQKTNDVEKELNTTAKAIYESYIREFINKN